MLSLLTKKINWTIVPEYQQTSLAQLFSSFDAAYDYPGELVAKSPLSQMYKTSIDGVVYSIKKYNISRKILQRYIGQSKVYTEWQNLFWFRSLGIAVPNVIAYGEEKQGWVTHRGIIIMEELKNTHDLRHIADNNPQLIQSSQWLNQVSHQLADVTRLLHQQHFAHNDLKWRNILVDSNVDYPQIYLIDCPSGRKWLKPFLNYRIIKDLACLDKRGKYELSKKQRLAFYKDYAQCRKLTAKHKKQIRKILKFFHNRE
jgi:tRNA A-37 threonylcarbamoyl transferase component Bud32